MFNKNTINCNKKFKYFKNKLKNCVIKAKTFKMDC